MANESLMMYPSGYGATKLYSQRPTDGIGDFTVSRPSGTGGFNATRVNANGIIEEVGTNIPRLDYSDGGCPVLLTEPQSTNLIDYSEDFSQVSWFKQLSTVLIPNTTISPDGTMNASTLQNATGIDITESVLQKNLISSGNSTGSIYVKTLGSTKVSLGIRTTEGGSAYSYKNYTFINSEWIRIDLSVVLGMEQIFICDTDGDVAIYGAQLEQQSSATSYIPTNGTAITRNADVVTDAGDVTTFNSEEGVLFFEASSLVNGVDGTSRISIDDGSINNRLQFSYDASPNKYFFLFVVDGVQIVYELNLFSVNQNQVNKFALKYKSGDFGFFVNGVKVYTSNAIFTPKPLAFTKLNLTNYNGDLTFQGKLKQLKYFKIALSDAELITLTTI